jgi:hypothetical protein
MVLLSKERLAIESALENCLPAVVAPEERRTVLDSSENDVLEFSTLVNLRRSHQRKQAATGIRQKSTTTPTDPEPVVTPNPSTPSPRQDLLRQLNSLIKAEEAKGVSAAVGRQLRWQTHNPGRRPAGATEAAPTVAAGNSANAAEVAATEAKKVRIFCRDLG